MSKIYAFLSLEFGGLGRGFWIAYIGVCILLGGAWIWIGKDILALMTGICGVSLAFFIGSGRAIGFVFSICYCALSTLLIVGKDYRLWGDVLLNLFYALVAIYGLITWRKEMCLKHDFFLGNNAFGLC